MRYHNLIKKIVLSVITVAALLFVPLTATAQTVGGGLDDLQTNSGNQIPEPVNVNSPQGVVALIALLIKWALYLSGAIAVVFIIIGGYKYMTAGGNEEQATSGRKSLINALIGLVIIILAYVIVNAVTSFLT